MSLPIELQAARLRLVKERPYLAAALWALQPIERPGLGSLAVDQYWRLYFDPAAFTRWSIEELAGVLYHELCHLLRNHPERLRNFDPHLANVAADAEINDNLIYEEVRLPGEPITPDTIGQPDGLLAEEYIAAMAQSAPDQPGSGGDAHGSKAGDAPASKAGDGAESISASSTTQVGVSSAQPGVSSQPPTGLVGNGHAGGQAGTELGDPVQTPAPGAGRCGSCATGQQEPWEDSPPGESTSPGISKTEAELIRREVARQIVEASTSRGDIPAYWRRWAEEKLRPKVDWRRELASAIRHAISDVAGAVDYSYRKPSRRQGQVGNGKVIFPSLRRPVPSVAVVVDTSGSISDEMLAQALAEISGILRGLGQREGVHVLAVDAAVQSCRRVFRPEQVELVGGGGTDMGAGLAAAEKLRPRPEVCIVITDGYTPWPEQPPRNMKVVVALTGNGKSPEWAKTIKVGGENEQK